MTPSSLRILNKLAFGIPHGLSKAAEGRSLLTRFDDEQLIPSEHPSKAESLSRRVLWLLRWQGLRLGPMAETGIPLFVIGCLLMVILLPLSFVTLDYTEYGLVQRRSTGKVYLNKPVYYGGRHFLGPDIKFRKFPADAQFIQLLQIDAVSADKLDTIIDVEFAFFLVRNEVVALKIELDQSYEQVIRNTALAAIKNTAVTFNTADYFLNRTLIEASFFKAVSGAVRPYHAVVPFIFMSGVTIPAQVSGKQLATAIQLQSNQQQIYASQAAVIRATTNQLVNQIANNATFLIQAASAQAAQIVQNAQTNATNTVQEARRSGLAYYYSTVNITLPKHKASLDYITTLQQAAGAAQLHIGYQTKIVTT
ncbi:hypothetical protein KFL_006590020 [Klebsormidium nitens]|uniref:Band 7 domain-containing protein n=1 Tax=Klebsormidium nitens TaxID=105231 RepID=A0A1Y1IMC0_KLENI|nr:hypothetical protein KFL_006590020 [Klebsormidium nitens]|eukprot:GAQ90589.1 hypothetical protein KFL_006590020 [Klebsormidium nitens]